MADTLATTINFHQHTCNVIAVKRSDVPRIPDEVLDTVVYLYPSEADAEDSKNAGGSGFLIGIPVPYSLPFKDLLICVVTNRHVVEGGSMILRTNTIFGDKEIVALDNDEWIFHPAGDDLALCPIVLRPSYKAKIITPNIFLRMDFVEAFDLGVGDDVFTVGRAINRDGRQKNLPSVRFGSIAQMPGEPLIDEKGFEQECYLVEARAIVGSSGSPVFIHFPATPLTLYDVYPHLGPNPHTPSTNRGKSQTDLGPFLLGISFCNIYLEENVYSPATGKLHDWYVKSNTGMMGVIPVWKLEELIDSPKMRKIRALPKPTANLVVLDVLCLLVSLCGREDPKQLAIILNE